MTGYNPQKIEKKWQKIWAVKKVFEAKDKSKEEKFYCLDMFPYPSGEGLHVGHPRGYIATDIISRCARMKGFNVLHPMGWDAFGLPAENYAIKTGIHPEISTRKNIKRFREQLNSIGLSYDWSREINTTNPEYYKWTQWIFLLLYKKGLAYEAVLPINFCPSCKTGLANEEVVDGKCERCGTLVMKKDLRQWVLKITAYADRLLNDLEGLDWPEKIITMQKNWIGRSEGWEIEFNVKCQMSNLKSIKVFTTRADTLFGCAYIVIAPENPIIEKLKNNISNYGQVKNYIEKAKQKSERERISEVKDKDGVGLKGISVINPVNGKEIPIFVADYVLAHYATGAVMAVPSHDQRDFDFAKKYNLQIINVIKPASQENISNKAYEGEGFLVSSGDFDNMDSKEAREKIGEWLKSKDLARKKVNYKLKDWIFSRQRYWGEPIPLVHCKKCGIVPLSEKDLPLKLPKVENYQPTGAGESPLADIKNWVKTKCPKCKGPAERETNTMPQWAGSCWYFLRYADQKNKKNFISPEKSKYWLPVDLYVGGAEHAVLHLLYSRFWIKVLYDENIIKFKEPFLKLRNQGLIMAPDGQKMSKSLGNVINPDSIIEKYGADTLRLYEMFMGPFEDMIFWDTKGIEGCYRFLNRAWNFQYKIAVDKQKIKDKSRMAGSRSAGKLESLVHKTIKKVGDDIKALKFNTAVSSLMILTNELDKEKEISSVLYSIFLTLLNPFAPHITEELWLKSGFKGFCCKQKWPEYNPEFIKEEKITLIIQINGKVRDKIEVEAGISEEAAKKTALASAKIKNWLESKEIKKIIFVAGKLINIVVVDKE